MPELSLYAIKPSQRGGLQLASDMSLRSLMREMGFSWSSDPESITKGDARQYRILGYEHHTGVHITVHSVLSESPQSHLVLATVQGETPGYTRDALERLEEFYASKHYRTEVLE